MSEHGSSSIWTDPALYISMAALGISAWQAFRSQSLEKRTNRRIEFIEFIAVEFSKIDSSLDSLETILRRADSMTSVTSDQILVEAIGALRVTNRSLTSVSAMKSVSQDLVVLSGVDQLDGIVRLADDGEFEKSTRNLHVSASLNIVRGVSKKCANIKIDVQKVHLN